MAGAYVESRLSSPSAGAHRRSVTSEPRGRRRFAALFAAMPLLGCTRSGRIICAPPRSSRRITRKSRAGRSRRRATMPPKANGGRRSATPNSIGSRPQVSVSNQTLKADEANYRQALALIAEARAGLFPDAEFQSVADARHRAPGLTSLDAEVTGSWTLDVWGKVRRTIEQQGAARAGQRRRARQCDPFLAIGAWRSPMCSCAKRIRCTICTPTRSSNTSVRCRSRKINMTPALAAKSDVITAQAQLLAAQALRDRHRGPAGAERTCDRGADGPAAVRTVHSARGSARRHPADSGRLALDAAGAPARHRRAPNARWHEQNAPIGVAIAGYYPDITLSGLGGLFRQSVHQAVAGANPIWSYGLALAQPLFNGGLTAAQVEAARDAYQASVATYRQTVLTAFQQVEDNLVAIRVYGAGSERSGRGGKVGAASRADRAERIPGRHAEFHDRRHRRGDGAERPIEPAVESHAATERRGEPRRCVGRGMERHRSAGAAFASPIARRQRFWGA